MYKAIKAAAISLKPRPWDKPYNADKLEQLFRQAAGTKAELLVATEAVLDGYVTQEVIKDPSLAPQMLELSEPIDGPYIKRFQKLARSLRRCLAFGFAERVRRDIYNAAIFIDHRGRICGKYHKTWLAEGYDPSWTFNRIGRQLRAFDTPLGRAGMLICADRWNPDIARALALDGAQMLLICSYGSRKKRQNQTVMARARENGLPIVEANVGMNLIISKGEVVSYKWGVDQITTGVIDVPTLPSTRAARQAERFHLERQGPEMKRRARITLHKIKQDRVQISRTDDNGRSGGRRAKGRATRRTS